MAAGGQGIAAVEDSDVVEAEKAALKNVHAVGVFAVDPPGEIQKQFVEDADEKSAVAAAVAFLVDLVDAPRGPGVDRRVYVSESPFVGRELAVGMHVPFAEDEHELLFGEIGIDQGERDAVKSQVPRGVPGIFPLVGHGDDVGVVEVRPIVIASGGALWRRRRIAGIAVQPLFDHVVIELLRPQESGEALAHYVFGVGRESLRNDGGVEFVGFLFAGGEDGIEVGESGGRLGDRRDS